MVHLGKLHPYYFALDHDFDLFLALTMILIFLHSTTIVNNYYLNTSRDSLKPVQKVLNLTVLSFWIG